MDFRGLTRFPRIVKHTSSHAVQPFKHLLVLDFEATCNEKNTLHPQEIIEFPCVALSTEDWSVKSTFHEYVKPRIHPALTAFCIKLTGIIPEMVATQPHFPDVFKKFQNWVDKEGFFKEKNKSAFVTCGDWDLKVMLPQQCDLDNLKVPKEFDQWVNLKDSYAVSTDYYPKGMNDMLLRLNLRRIGKAHSGIDDVTNMINIIRKLHDLYDTEFRYTSKRNVSKVPKENIA